MASIEGNGSGQTSVTTLPPPPPPAQPNTSSFFEPISGQTIARGGSQPVSQWVGGLPQSDVGLSTLNRWQAGSTPAGTTAQIEAELRAQISPPQTTNPLLRSTLIDSIQAPFDDIKVGYAMGQVAAGIEARIAANPGVPSAEARALATELRNRGSILSDGAAREATNQPGVYAFNGKCYSDANGLARAVLAERANPTRPTLREYTPEMQQRDAQAAMDRAVLSQSSPLGATWAQTAYMYARGNGASLEQQQRAYALGQGGDALLGVAGAFAGASTARSGNALPGGQATPTLTPRTGTPTAIPRTNIGAPTGVPTGAPAGATYRAIVGQVPGRIVSESNAMSVGPLGNDVGGLPGTFSGGRYATIELTQPMTVYRAWTPGQSREFGGFWSLERPAGSLQTRIDSALLPEWGTIRGTAFRAQASQYTAIELPAGTVIHVGEVGSQGGPWVGGRSQLLIDGGANPAWKVGGAPLK